VYYSGNTLTKFPSTNRQSEVFDGHRSLLTTPTIGSSDQSAHFNRLDWSPRVHHHPDINSDYSPESRENNAK